MILSQPTACASHLLGANTPGIRGCAQVRRGSGCRGWEPYANFQATAWRRACSPYVYNPYVYRSFGYTPYVCSRLCRWVRLLVSRVMVF